MAEPTLLMPASAFDRAVALILTLEGGHSDRPAADDPGGDTWYGLSRRAHPVRPWPPTRDEAMAVYRQEYWDPVHGDALPWPVNLVVFDAAVQHGVDRAIRGLQQALGVRVDGILGPVTQAAAQQAGAPALVDELLARRLVAYPTLAPWEPNKLGWMRRVLAVHRVACT